MELNEFQEQSVSAIKARLGKKGIELNTDMLLIHLVEEFGGIAQQIMNKKLKRRELDVNNIAEEISDCMILLSALAKQFDINLDQALNNKLNELRNKTN